MHKIFLCLRYLRKKRLAFFGIVAVALCVTLLIVITSLFDGFIHSIKNYWQSSYGQVVLFVTTPLHDYDDLVSHLEQVPGVESARPVNSTGALLYLGRGNVKGVEVQGVDMAHQLQDQSFHKGLLLQADKESPVFSLSAQAKESFDTWYQKRFKMPPTPDKYPIGAIIGIGVISQLDEQTDQYNHDQTRQNVLKTKAPLSIISAISDPSSSSSQAIKKLTIPCWPVDVVQTGVHLNDTHNVYVPFNYLRDMIGTEGPDGKKYCKGRIQIFAKPGTDVEVLHEQLQASWVQYARTELRWPDRFIYNSPMYKSMDMPRLVLFTSEIKKQLAIMQIIMGFICLVAALLIFVILFMIVMQKKKDIGIMRAIGASGKSIASLFLLYGASIGTVGSLIGLALGVWATQNIALLEMVLSNILGFKIWKSGVYFFSEIPNEVAWSAVTWIVLTGLVTATLGALLPAYRATRMKPVEPLRYE